MSIRSLFSNRRPIDRPIEKVIDYYENPRKKLQRIASTYLNFGWRGYRSFISDMPVWLTRKVHVKRTVNRDLRQLFGKHVPLPPIDYIDHHESHAASAFFPSRNWLSRPPAP